MAYTSYKRFIKEYTDLHNLLCTYTYTNLTQTIIMYVVDPPMKLLDWIKPKNIVEERLSENINAVDWLAENLNKIDWFYLSGNPNAIELIKYGLEEHPHRISWMMLSKNHAAIDILNENKENICPITIGYNKNAEDIIRSMHGELKYGTINANPLFIESYQKDPDTITNWLELSLNPSPITSSILKNNIDRINWRNLSSNEYTFELLMEYPEKIDWDWLSENPNPKAIEMLKENQHLIHWYNFSMNRSIYEVDYKFIHELSKVCSTGCID